MYSQDQHDQHDARNQMGQTDQSTDDDMGNQDTRPTLDPGGRVIETPQGAPADPQNTHVRLTDGRTVEVPPSNLAAAKELLAAQNAAERRRAQPDQPDQSDQQQMSQQDYTDQ
ncbi:MAG: hypothetical protein ABI068_08715 [Ktedonobacterales bacterium]